MCQVPRQLQRGVRGSAGRRLPGADGGSGREDRLRGQRREAPQALQAHPQRRPLGRPRHLRRAGQWQLAGLAVPAFLVS